MICLIKLVALEDVQQHITGHCCFGVKKKKKKRKFVSRKEVALANDEAPSLSLLIDAVGSCSGVSYPVYYTTVTQIVSLSLMHDK